MSDKKVTPQPGPAPDCEEMRKEKKSTPLTLEEMKEMHIGASHEQPPVGAETSEMAPPPEVEFIENVGKAVSGAMDMAVSAVDSAEKFLNDCACEVSSWGWGFFNPLLDGARGYSGEGGWFTRNKFWGAVTKGTHNFVYGTVKGLFNMVGHPVETATGIGHAVTHPKELLNGLKEQYWGSRKNWTEKVSGVTKAICDIAFLAYGAKKGFDKLSKGSKAGKAAKIAESGETAGKAAKAGEVAEEAAKAGEVAEEAAKAGEVGEEAAKAGEKAGGKVKIESGSNTKYYNSDGSPIWPPNRGFEGNPTTTTLEPGTLVDRYGYDGGTFVSPKGTPYTERALPTGTDKKPYTVFEVVKPVEVQAGKIAPWFGEKGGGIQYEFSEKIADLLDKGILRKVGN